MRYYLTFDIGTTSVKTCLFDEAFVRTASANDEYLLETPQTGFVELAPETYWRAVCHGAKRVLESAGIDASEVETVSVTTQGETLIPIGRDGTALRHAIVWLDERAGEQAARLSQKMDAATFYQETGLPEISGYLPICKLMWIRDNEPQIYEATEKFLLLEDYILYRLTGRFVTEKSISCSTGWYCFAADGQWDEMLRLAELDAEKLPEMVEPGTVISRGVLAEVRTELGFSENVLVVTGAMDQTAGAVGAGNLVPGRVTETTGTALCIGATLTHPDLTHPSHVTVYRHVRSGLYLMMPICMTAGMCLKWFKDSFCDAEIARAKAEDRSVYAVIDEVVSGVEAGSRGLIALPYLTGTLQPHSDPNARGVFFGVGLDTKRPEFLRAIFEGVAFMLRENLELVERVNHCKTEEVRALGGGASSDVWLEIKADVTHLPIGVPAESESTSLGAAMLAAVAAGAYADLEACIAAVDRGLRWTQPSGETCYDAIYEKYCALYERVEPLF